MKVLRRFLIGAAVWTAASVASALAVRALVREFGEAGDDDFSVVAAMDGREFMSTASAFASGTVTTFMGGAEIDLRGTSIDDHATLSLRAFMGGIDVIVPAEWRVEVASTVIMGGISNLSDPDGATDDAPVLLVDAVIAMGGVEIHAAEPA